GLTVDMLRTLLQMIEEKQRLVRLLNEYIDGPGLTVVIGAEHLDPGLRPFSLIASRYDDGAGTGTIGVIGPTRMQYSRAIAVDDFDLALTVDADETEGPYKKGIELIHAKLHDLLRKYGVRPIETIGADFDPNLHQAVIHEVSPEHREGEVIGELRRGYMMNDRLLRPALVRVAKA